MFDQVTAAKERMLKRYIYGQKVIDIKRQLLKLFSFLITISYSDELDFQIDCLNILKWKMYETHKCYSRKGQRLLLYKSRKLITVSLKVISIRPINLSLKLYLYMQTSLSK